MLEKFTAMKRKKLPPLNSLKAFEAVARHQSFSLAADELCVTHSAMSHQIKLLEQWLDRKLFIRHASTISLTPEAEQLLSICSNFFNDLEQCIADLTRKAVDVEIVIGAAHSFMANWLIPRLEKFESAHPHVQIKLMTCDDYKLLETEKIDIFIGSLKSDTVLPQRIEQSILFPDYMGPICNATAYPLTQIEDIFHAPLLHTQSNRNAWSIWMNKLGITTTQVKNERYFDRLNLMVEAAVSGLGVAIAPQLLVEKEILSGRIIAPFGFVYCDYSFYALTRKKADAECVQVVEWLQAEAQQLG